MTLHNVPTMTGEAKTSVSASLGDQITSSVTTIAPVTRLFANRQSAVRLDNSID